jgi:hypothetical protein
MAVNIAFRSMSLKTNQSNPPATAREMAYVRMFFIEKEVQKFNV